MNKHLTLYESHSQYVEPTVKPNVSYCIAENEVHYNPHTFADEYFTTVARENGTISFNIWKSMGTDMIKSISYSTDNGETWTEGSSVQVSSGDKVMWKGEMTPLARYGIGNFSSTANFDVQGNAMSLLYGDNYMGQTNLTGSDNAFYKLFSGNTKVINAENLSLPATTLAKYCYGDMFSGCTSLTTAPELPATTLAQYCYREMFYGCTSLTTAPELPVTTLVDYCYTSMFEGCTNLTTAPALPATALSNYCYFHMFEGCTSLTVAPELPATTLAKYCYGDMFSGCTSLTTAPELPATTLTDYCYYNMFRGCTSLNSITCLATDISATSCKDDWVNGVASSGTFVKNSAATWTTTGDSGIPNGWTVQTASN